MAKRRPVAIDPTGEFLMNRKQSAAVKSRVSEDQRIDDALNLAAQDAVEAHRKAGLPLAVWKDGQVVWIQPDEVETPPNGKRQKSTRRTRKT